MATTLLPAISAAVNATAHDIAVTVDHATQGEWVVDVSPPGYGQPPDVATLAKWVKTTKKPNQRMSRQFVDTLAPNQRHLRQIEYVQELGLLMPNVIFAEIFLQAPLPDNVREGAAADPEPF